LWWPLLTSQQNITTSGLTMQRIVAWPKTKLPSSWYARATSCSYKNIIVDRIAQQVFENSQRMAHQMAWKRCQTACGSLKAPCYGSNIPTAHRKIECSTVTSSRLAYLKTLLSFEGLDAVVFVKTLFNDFFLFFGFLLWSSSSRSSERSSVRPSSSEASSLKFFMSCSMRCCCVSTIRCWP
jgi:hypothetical protein